MAKLEAYVAVEKTVAATLAAAWTKRARPIMVELKEAIDAHRFNQARDIAWAITMDGVASAQRNRLEELAVSAMLLGAARLVPMKQTIFMTALPPLLGPAVDQFIKIIGASAETVRKNALPLIDVEEDAFRRVAEVSKADKFTLAEKLNGIVLGTGKGLIAASWCRSARSRRWCRSRSW